jgi:hypothetical protein
VAGTGFSPDIRSRIVGTVIDGAMVIRRRPFCKGAG